jgi:predicted permease
MVHAQDVRYALRLLGRSPGFALLTVLVLAGGLGISTFTFSFLHTAMVRAIPLAEGDRVVRLTVQEDGRRRPMAAADLVALRDGLRTVQQMGAYATHDVVLAREADSRLLSTTVTDPVLFAMTRTPPWLGRALEPADASPGAEPVVVLAHRAWTVAFGADRGAIGSLVSINGTRTRVVGVMPPGFGFPVAQDAWMAMPATSGGVIPPGLEWVSLFGRLAPGVTPAQAEAEATTRLQRAVAERRRASGTVQAAPVIGMVVESFPEAQFGEDRALLFLALNAAAWLILLLSLVNVATLLTARANERVRETAVRLALGAPTSRLIAQGMWEGVLLCLIGGAVGTAATAWGLEAITGWIYRHLAENAAFWWVWRADRITLLAAGAFLTVAIATVGAVVSLRATRTNVLEVMQDTTARAGSRREGRLARILVATQVAAVTVLMFAGVLGAILATRVLNLDPGYDPARLLQVTLAPSADRFPTPDARARVFTGVLDRLASHGALDGVLLRTRIADREDGGGFTIADRPLDGRPAAQVMATLGPLATLGITVGEGRPPLPTDTRSQPPVAVVSRALATRFWPGRSPIGQRIRLAGHGDAEPWRTIVGVVSDIPYGNLIARERSLDAVYVPLLQTDVADTEVMTRYRTSEVAARQALFETFAAVDPQLVPGHVFRMEEALEKSSLITVGLMKLIGGCFAFALLMAVAGTYGLMSRAIALRTREIGVRRALGATDAAATRLLLLQGARQLGVGALVASPVLIVLGVGAASLLQLGGTLVTSLGVLVSLSIVGVVLATTWVPTRKAMRVPLRTALVRE